MDTMTLSTPLMDTLPNATVQLVQDTVNQVFDATGNTNDAKSSFVFGSNYGGNGGRSGLFGENTADTTKIGMATNLQSSIPIDRTDPGVMSTQSLTLTNEGGSLNATRDEAEPTPDTTTSSGRGFRVSSGGPLSNIRGFKINTKGETLMGVAVDESVPSSNMNNARLVDRQGSDVFTNSYNNAANSNSDCSGSDCQYYRQKLPNSNGEDRNRLPNNDGSHLSDLIVEDSNPAMTSSRDFEPDGVSPKCFGSQCEGKYGVKNDGAIREYMIPGGEPLQSEFVVNQATVVDPALVPLNNDPIVTVFSQTSSDSSVYPQDSVECLGKRCKYDVQDGTGSNVGDNHRPYKSSTTSDIQSYTLSNDPSSILDVSAALPDVNNPESTSSQHMIIDTGTCVECSKAGCRTKRGKCSGRIDNQNANVLNAMALDYDMNTDQTTQLQQTMENGERMGTHPKCQGGRCSNGRSYGRDDSSGFLGRQKLKLQEGTSQP
jgi:hypothetical protein